MMDRLAQLIGKLNEQFEQKASPAQLLVTAQLIEAELSAQISSSSKPLTSTKVSVTMPSAPRQTVQNEPVTIAKSRIPISLFPGDIVPATSPEKEEKNGRAFDPMIDIPTLSHQNRGRELNEVMAGAANSLNDSLKAAVVEVGHILTEVPIRDLRKAIGINDRFVFINDLFRGDDIMFERSIKTINSFHVYQEALFWMERELKLKLRWDDQKSTTQHFYQLVKRRFS